MATIETGKYKGKTLAQCPPLYILWASRHEKNFADGNKWVARDAKKLLEPAAPVAQGNDNWNEWEHALQSETPAPVVVEPKQTYRIISLGNKKERRDLVAEMEARRESKFALLGEINEIKDRKRSADLGSKGNLNRKAFSILR